MLSIAVSNESIPLAQEQITRILSQAIKPCCNNCSSINQNSVSETFSSLLHIYAIVHKIHTQVLQLCASLCPPLSLILVSILINVNENDYCWVKLQVKRVKHEVVSPEAVTQSIKTSLLWQNIFLIGDLKQGLTASASDGSYQTLMYGCWRASSTEILFEASITSIFDNKSLAWLAAKVKFST